MFQILLYRTHKRLYCHILGTLSVMLMAFFHDDDRHHRALFALALDQKARKLHYFRSEFLMHTTTLYPTLFCPLKYLHYLFRVELTHLRAILRDPVLLLVLCCLFLADVVLVLKPY